jgi:hypothetical protein
MMRRLQHRHPLTVIVGRMNIRESRAAKNNRGNRQAQLNFSGINLNHLLLKLAQALGKENESKCLVQFSLPFKRLLSLTKLF